MAYDVTLYCPDTNIRISGSLAEIKALGGRTIAIVKMAEALGHMGHKVTVYGHVEEEQYKNVEYLRHEKLNDIQTDIFIATTAFRNDLSELKERKISARAKIVWFRNASPVKGLDALEVDYFYAPSVFLQKKAVEQWGLPLGKVVPVHHGYDHNEFGGLEAASERDKYGIIFATHPAKGLDRVLDIFTGLKSVDSRFHLDIYSSYKLWNDDDNTGLQLPDEEGIRYRGLIPQRDLVRVMHEYNFMFHLTDYEDAISSVLTHAVRCGIITIASNAGGNSEVITDGYNGFIIDEHYLLQKCEEKVLRLVEYLNRKDEYAEYIRKNGMAYSLSWEKVAGDWTGHWDEIFRTEQAHRKKFVISGWYGSGNIGDEAILQCVIDTIHDIDPDAETTVVSVDVFHTEKHHRCKAVDRNDFQEMARVIKASDCVIFGGGGLFQDYQTIEPFMMFSRPSVGVTSFAPFPILAKIYQKPLIYYAQGFGPLFSEDAISFIRFMCELADVITVRDRQSYDLLRFIAVDEKKVHLTADPVVNLALLPDDRLRYLFLGEDIPPDRKLIAVVVRFWLEKSVEEKIISAIAETIKLFLKANKGYFFVFIPFCYADININKRILDLVEEKQSAYILKREYSPAVIATFLSKTDALIGMRFHSCVFAALGRVPFIALSYDNKVEMFAKETGLEEFIVHMDALDSGIAGKLESLLRKRSILIQEMTGRLADIASKEMLNRQLLQGFIHWQDRDDSSERQAF